MESVLGVQEGVQEPGRYFIGGFAFGNGIGTSSGCNGGTNQIPQTVDAGTDTTASFSLPSKVAQQLSQTSQDFDGPDWLKASTKWSISFTATPNYKPDDDCKDTPDAGVPENSSIGCQSQSLGEDIPVAGTGFRLYYESGRAPGAGGDSVASTDAAMIGGWTLGVHHAYDPNTNTLFLGDGGQRNGYQLGKPVSYQGNLLLTSKDGGEVYVFSGKTGQHLQTLRPLTGALVYQFGYDAVGKLVTVKDAAGNITTIQRNAAEEPTAIVSPYGQITTLKLSGSGALSRVTDPLAQAENLVTTTTGLLTSRTDANGNVFHYTYDANGRLIKDADPLGGFIAAVRTNAASGFGWTVGETTSMGRTTSYQSALTIPWVETSNSTFLKEQTNTWPDGLHATSSRKLENGQLTESFDLPDRTSESATSESDPVWGIQVPVITAQSLTLGSLMMKITRSRSTTLGTVGNPFSRTTMTDTQTINNRTYTSTYTASDHTYVQSTPVGRTLSVVLDSLERVASTQVGGQAATEFRYDSRGRLASATRGTRKTTFSYTSQGFLASVTDPLQLTTSFTYDADGRLLRTSLPDGRSIGYAYDANGNLTSITPPGKSAHKFTYTAVDLQSSYTPPADAGTGSTNYAYDLDRDPTAITRPDGEKIEYGYDSTGRLNSTTTPTETIDYSYDPATGNLSSASIQRGEALDYGYNGPLLTSSTLTGKVAGTVSRAYDNNFWTTSESINSGNTVEFTLDKDGLVTNAGPLAITRDPKDGLISETALGNATESLNYDEFGDLTARVATYKTKTLYSVAYTRDADGRVAAETESIGGQRNTYTYTYDEAGRLIEVMKNGSHYSSYTYDTNSNRMTAVTSTGTVSGTYDDQDRLLTYGNTSFTYTANGELESQAVGGQKTTYSYDTLGNLIAVILPNGTKISYIVDPENHRIGKEVNGVLETGFLFDGGRIIAQSNGSNQIISRFVYGTGATSPDYMVRGGVTYRIFADQLGSPVIVVNTSTGAIAEQISYDEFGNVLIDTTPGFQPFGFAGGLYDQDTKLVRFGARDYNASIGRWTAKDPIRFSGGDSNLYGYVLSNPVNLTDSFGLQGNCTCEQTPKPKAPKIPGPLGKLQTALSDGYSGGEWISSIFEQAMGKSIGDAIYDILHPLDNLPAVDPLVTPVPSNIIYLGNYQRPSLSSRQLKEIQNFHKDCDASTSTPTSSSTPTSAPFDPLSLLFPISGPFFGGP
jgi:RHS repeat-associated protein